MTTSAFAGPYVVVQQSVGSKGWLLQLAPQGGGLGQGVPASARDRIGPGTWRPRA